MAEFLVKNFTGGEELPGDIVEVRPDGAVYGRKELLAEKFLIIKVPGLDYAGSLYLADALIDDTDPENPIVLSRRRYSVEDALTFLGPYLVEGNIYEVPVHASWNSFIKDKSLV